MQSLLKSGLIILVTLELLNINGFAQTTFDAQIKKMSDTLVARLLRTGKKRIAVSNFVDLQGNTTELGKYIAESFSVELSNTELNVVDRSRINDLMQELKLTDEKLTKPENALKLGEMAGVEYIITGTTVPLETTVDVTIKALDIQNGISIAGQRGSVPRTDAVNNLMNSNISEGNTIAANVNAGKKIDMKNKTAADVIFEVGITDMRKSECEVPRAGIYAQNVFDSYGQVCFENQTEYDLILSIPFDEMYPDMKVIIPKGGRNCWPKVLVNKYGAETSVRDYTFTFTTTNTNLRKTGTFLMTVEKCRLKSIVLTKKNLLLQ